MAQGKTDNLEAFAKRIATRVRAGGGTDSMERLICRLLTGKDVKVAAMLASKWTEWRYGKPKEQIEHSGSIGFTDALVKFTKRDKGANGGT